MGDLPTDTWAVIGTAAAGLVTGVLWLRTKMSRDSTAIANDRAEVDMISRLQEENKELRSSLAEVSGERNRLYKDVGEMAGSIRALEASQKLMEEHVSQLKEQIASLRDALERSNEQRPN
ncbi:hypothetical protein G3A39_41825 [Paraburkholderia aspalathi]|nr:hypothetical protein [Paraburkholderia aspalathi]